MIAPNVAFRPAPPRILGIDPGSTASGVCVYDPAISSPVVYAAKVDNVALLAALRARELPGVSLSGPHVMVVEMMQARGMPTANAELRTLVWLGRLIEGWGGEWAEVFRKDVKMNLCGKVTANDGNIRRALIDRFGGDAAIASVKKCPKCKGSGKVGRGKARDRCDWAHPDVGACNGTGRVGTDGPLYGVKADAWSALALCLTFVDRSVDRPATGKEAT